MKGGKGKERKGRVGGREGGRVEGRRGRGEEGMEKRENKRGWTRISEAWRNVHTAVHIDTLKVTAKALCTNIASHMGILPHCTPRVM